MVGDNGGAFQEHEEVAPERVRVQYVGAPGDVGEQVEVAGQVACGDGTRGGTVPLSRGIDDRATAEAGGGEPGSKGAEDGGESRSWISASRVRRIGDPGQDTSGPVLQDGLDEAVLRVEVAVQGLFGNARGGAEFGNTDAVESAFVQERGR